MLTEDVDFGLGEAKLGVRDGSRKGGHVCYPPHISGEGEQLWVNHIVMRREEELLGGLRDVKL